MGAVRTSLPARLAMVVGGVQLALLPFFFLQLSRMAYESNTEQFVNDIRSYSRFLADTLDSAIDGLGDPSAHIFLDRIVLSQDAVYAALLDNNENRIISEFSAPPNEDLPDDFAFGEHQDDVYVIRIPIESIRGEPLTLTLGFDEAPTRAAIESVEHRILVAAALFLALSVTLTIVLAYYVARPLRELRAASRRIADKHFAEQFRVESNVREISDLAKDLENMRSSLVAANQRLADEVSERERLEVARQELERTLRHVDKLETVGTLAGGIAHEINNALQPIRLYTELAIESLPEESAERKDLNRALIAAERAREIVEKILTFSRRSLDDRFVEVDVAAVTKDAVTFARDLFASSIVIRYHGSIDGAIVRGSPTQIHQLVMNLCNNAYAAIPRHSGQIDVTVSRRVVPEIDAPDNANVTPEEYVTIEVADNGHGMDPLTIERVFEPFFTTRQPGEGSGLGMSVVHGIVKSHGGFIKVESELDEGSVFTVYLPPIDTAVEVS